MPPFSEILSLVSLIYSDVIEIIFCLLYAYIIVRISAARSSEFRSAFYKFSIATGIAAISNVLLNFAIRMIDVRFQFFPNRGTICNIFSMLSHTCALAVSIGKTLSVSTRYTAICFATKRDERKVSACLIGMFGIPVILYSYFPFLSPVFGPTPNGYRVYLGVEAPGFMIAKAFATCGYFFFFFSTIPMCTLSMLRLRSERLSRPQGDVPISSHGVKSLLNVFLTIAKPNNVKQMSAEMQKETEASQARISTGRHEKILGIYAVVLTTSHMFKTILQSIWFIALVLGLKELQTTVISQYLIPNTLSAFAEPVLLLVTSPKLRDEVFPWRTRKGRSVTTTATSKSILSSSAINRAKIEPSQVVLTFRN